MNIVRIGNFRRVLILSFKFKFCWEGVERERLNTDEKSVRFCKVLRKWEGVGSR